MTAPHPGKCVPDLQEAEIRRDAGGWSEASTWTWKSEPASEEDRSGSNTDDRWQNAFKV